MTIHDATAASSSTRSLEVVGSFDTLGVSVIRGLAMDAVEKAGSGHPGTAMALAPLAHVLWTRVMNYDSAQPDWPDRDRFVLSAGHASILQYSILYLTGFGLELDDLKAFRTFGSRTPGHPERGHTAGVEVTTGPLGQGFAAAVGLAFAEANQRARFGSEICSHHTFVIASDGDLMEGISHEAASIASDRPSMIRLRSHIGYPAPTKTDSSSAHGNPLGADEIVATKTILGLPQTDFFVPDEILATYRGAGSRGSVRPQRGT